MKKKKRAIRNLIIAINDCLQANFTVEQTNTIVRLVLKGHRSE